MYDAMCNNVVITMFKKKGLTKMKFQLIAPSFNEAKEITLPVSPIKKCQCGRMVTGEDHLEFFKEHGRCLMCDKLSMCAYDGCDEYEEWGVK